MSEDISTIRARGKYNSRLEEYVAFWPDHNTGGKVCSAKIASSKTAVSGQLNPTWVEWLMGFPTGWTDLNS
jgi:hypothetical protein